MWQDQTGQCFNMMIRTLLLAFLATAILAEKKKPLQGKQTRILHSYKYNTGNKLNQVPKDAEAEHRRPRTRSKRSRESRVCYGEFGCFGDAHIWRMRNLPSSPQEVGTHFRLYSPGNRGGQALVVSASNMSAAWGRASRALDPHHPTKVIVHGFDGNCDVVWVNKMRYALMDVEKCNLICVDWKDGAIMPDYLRAVANARLVGKQLALFLHGLKKIIHLKFENLHIIGFSLGAHVAGFAGAELKNVARITGLDPARPNFESEEPRAGLDRTDARFVDVIHTNGGALGVAQSIGHVDFYPNGGSVQPGCPNSYLSIVADVSSWIGFSPQDNGGCNHRRAHKLFIDSISPKFHFLAFPCDDYKSFVEGRCFSCKGNCGIMGYYSDKSPGRGQLYLLTEEKEPFYANQYHVSVWASSSTGEKADFGRLTLTMHGDSGNSETFPMTVTDGRNGRARFTQVIVLRRALGVPMRASLTYSAYDITILRSFFNCNAKSIQIHKLLVTDDLARTSSFCVKEMQLPSQNNKEMLLYPGDCALEDEHALETTSTEIPA